MKPKRRWNERTRLILTLELAVVLPATALVILSAWHLMHIQRDRAVEAAIQRDFSQMLAISEKEFNRKAYEQLDGRLRYRAVIDGETQDEPVGPRWGKVESALLRRRRSHSAVDQRECE